MNKYQLLAFYDGLSTTAVITIILIAVIYQNYWILLLILLAGVSEERENRILNSK